MTAAETLLFVVAVVISIMSIVLVIGLVCIVILVFADLCSEQWIKIKLRHSAANKGAE
jgi:hypothetical protein